MKPHHLGRNGLADPVRSVKSDWAFNGSTGAEPKHRLDRKHSHKHLTRWTPKVMAPGYPVAGSQGVNALAMALSPSESKKKVWRAFQPGDDESLSFITEEGVKLSPVLVPITLPDGSTKLIQPKIKKRILQCCAYGTSFTFIRTGAHLTVRDSRDGKSKTLAFIRAELIRMFGGNGVRAYEHLTA